MIRARTTTVLACCIASLAVGGCYESHILNASSSDLPGDGGEPDGGEPASDAGTFDGSTGDAGASLGDSFDLDAP